MSILLWIASFCLRSALGPFQLLHTLIDSFRWTGKWKLISRAAFQAALANDVYGCMAYANMLNAWFIKRGGYHYGKKGETISSATGKGWVRGMLSFLGLSLCGALNFIDVSTRKYGGHCFVYIEADRGETYERPDRIKWYYTAVGLIGVSVAGIIGLAWRVAVVFFVVRGIIEMI